MARYDTLEETLREEYHKVCVSSQSSGSSSYVLAHAPTSFIVAALEDQLLNLTSAVFFGTYSRLDREETDDNMRQRLIVRAYKTSLWYACLLAISWGVGYEALAWGHWLVRGIDRFKDFAGNPTVISSLVFKCGRELERMSVTPSNSIYIGQSLLREIVFCMGCLGGAIGVSEEELVKQIRTEWKATTSNRRKRRSFVESTLNEIRKGREGMLAGGRRSILDLWGANEPGTLGRLCVALGDMRVNLLASASKTELFEGRAVMHYKAWVETPSTMSLEEVIMQLNQSASIREFLIFEPGFYREDVDEERWSAVASEFVQPCLTYDVWTDGQGPQSKTHAEVAELRRKQETEKAPDIDIFYDDPRRWCWVAGDRVVVDGEDERTMLKYLSQAGEGHRSGREMKSRGFHVSNATTIFQRCERKLKGHLQHDAEMHWCLTGSCCCVMAASNR